MRRLFLHLLPVIFLILFGMRTACSQQPKGEDQTRAQTQQPGVQPTDPCLECHMRITPGIVVDWQLSKHSANDVGCSRCHGDGHNSMTDPAKAGFAGPQVCAGCHDVQVEQFAKGKHALAWGAMKAMPTLHWQPMAQVEGLKGCGGCHRVGLKTEGEVRDLIEKKSGFGLSSCDVCHTRHVFSVDEARSPQACRTCHMGIDHPQWEMYSSSKHGVRFLLKQSRILPEDAAAPTCQSCHFADGNHANRTAWGFLALRFPYPQDVQWAGDRQLIMEALGIFDPEGKPTPRMAVVETFKFIKFSEGDWKTEREKMLKSCNDCHSVNFARTELEKADRMIREADGLMAEAIRTVAALYQEGLLKKPDYYSYAFPDLLALHNAPTVIEQKLFSMFLEYRMRTFQGAFHASPDYSFWYGWAPMQRSLAEISERAGEMRSARSGGREPASRESEVKE
ncbi:MAG TPA: multiheme c-type cytochrome [Syntrophobacteraceae bacterium]|nr:multiheme c-type cytochrome [Syntrophobacteraceae bacterium]